MSNQCIQNSRDDKNARKIKIFYKEDKHTLRLHFLGIIEVLRGVRVVGFPGLAPHLNSLEGNQETADCRLDICNFLTPLTALLGANMFMSVSVLRGIYWATYKTSQSSHQTNFILALFSQETNYHSNMFIQDLIPG